VPNNFLKEYSKNIILSSFIHPHDFMWNTKEDILTSRGIELTLIA